MNVEVPMNAETDGNECEGTHGSGNRRK